MGFNFRKRINILKGVTLNLSKSSVSLTIGGRGGSINIGKNGIYGNMSIPGTGIYARERLSSPKPINIIKKHKQENYMTAHIEKNDAKYEEIHYNSRNDAGWSSDITDADKDYAKQYVDKIKDGEIIVKLVVAGVPPTYFIETYDSSYEDDGRYKIIYRTKSATKRQY